jgi:hypothetical protein
MKKVYLLIADYGSWDSHRTKPIKCFVNLDDALSYGERYKKTMWRANMLCKPVNNEGEKGFDVITLFDQAMWGKYHNWADFNNCVVEEMDLIE